MLVLHWSRLRHRQHWVLHRRDGEVVEECGFDDWERALGLARVGWVVEAEIDGEFARKRHGHADEHSHGECAEEEEMRCRSHAF